MKVRDLRLRNWDKAGKGEGEESRGRQKEITWEEVRNPRIRVERTGEVESNAKI